MSLNQRPGGYLLRTGAKPGATIQAQELINGLEIDDLYKRDGASAGITLHHDLITDRWLDTEGNTFFGVDVAGGGNLANTVGQEGWFNTALGKSTLNDITTGYQLTAIGYNALINATDAGDTVAVGAYAASAGANGSQGTFVGAFAGRYSDGNYNSAYGYNSLSSNITGQYNTAIGALAGQNADNNLNSCVYIGYGAGKSNTVANSLWIHNSDAATPLIFGLFDQLRLGINQANPATTLDVGGDARISDGLQLDTLVPLSANILVEVDGGLFSIVDSGDSNENRVVLGDLSGSGGYLSLVNDSGVGNAVIRSYATSSTQAYFLAGNIGAGLTTAIDKFHAHGTANTFFRATNDTTGATATDGVIFGVGTGQAATLWNYENTPLIFGVNNVEVARFDSSGNLGVNISSSLDGKVDVYSTSFPVANVTRDTAGDGLRGALAVTRKSDTPADTDGILIYFRVENDNNEIINAGAFGSRLTDVSDGTEKAQLVWAIADGGVDPYNQIKMALNGSGQLSVGHTNPDTIFDVAGAITFRELSADPSDPAEGSAVIWMTDGTGAAGDDGDVLIKATAGGVTKTVTLLDHSAA